MKVPVAVPTLNRQEWVQLDNCVHNQGSYRALQTTYRHHLSPNMASHPAIGSNSSFE